jgi:hypothetical protein
VKETTIKLSRKKGKNNIKYLNKRLKLLDYDEGIKIICTQNNSNIFINKNINNEFIIQIENGIQKNKKEVLYFDKRNDLINYIQNNCTATLDFIEY